MAYRVVFVAAAPRRRRPVRRLYRRIYTRPAPRRWARRPCPDCGATMKPAGGGLPAHCNSCGYGID